MKKYLFVLLALFAITLNACKKDALNVKQEKTFVQVGATGSNLGFGGVILTLLPDGKADLMLGGDIVWRGTYSISGKNIKVVIDGETKLYRFTIVSENEIKYNETGAILRLSQS